MSFTTTELDDMEPMVRRSSAPTTTVVNSASPFQPTTVPNNPSQTQLGSKFRYAELYPFACGCVAWLLVGAAAFFSAWGTPGFEEVNGSFWLNAQFTFRFGFLIVSTTCIAAASILFLLFLRFCSKFFVLIYIVALSALIICLIFLIMMGANDWIVNNEMGIHAWLSLVVYIPFGVFFIMLLKSFEKKDVDTISTFIEDSAEAIFFLPHLMIIMLPMSMCLLLEIICSVLMLCSVPWAFSSIWVTVPAFAIVVLGIKWTVFFTIDFIYLVLTSAFTTWRARKDKTMLKRGSILSEIPSSIKRGLGNVVFGSSLISTVWQWAALSMRWPLHYSSIIACPILLLLQFFSNGAYTTHVITKKDHKASVKIFADISSRYVIKSFNYVLVDIVLRSAWVSLVFFVPILASFCMGGPELPSGLHIELSWFLLWVQNFAISHSWHVAYSTMVVHRISAESRLLESTSVQA